MCHWEESATETTLLWDATSIYPSPAGRTPTGRLRFQSCETPDLPDYMPCPISLERTRQAMSAGGFEARLIEGCRVEQEDAVLCAAFKYADELRRVAQAAASRQNAAGQLCREAEEAAVAMLLVQTERRTDVEAGVRDAVWAAVVEQYGDEDEEEGGVRRVGKGKGSTWKRVKRGLSVRRGQRVDRE